MYFFPHLEPVHCFKSVSVASWPAYRFLKRQVMYGIPTSLRISHSLLFSTQSKALAEMFFWNPLAFSMIQWMLTIFDLWFFLPFINPAYTSGSSCVHILLKPNLKDFEHKLGSMGSDGNCLIFWTIFSTAPLGNWDEDWHFPVLWPLLSFPNLLTYWLQHFNSIIF